MTHKRPESVLVVIYEKAQGRVLMLQRRDDPTFWQSVTGSLEEGESPRETALREVKEETGIDIFRQALSFIDCERSLYYEIFAHFRYRYAPGVTHNKEHWFVLCLPQACELALTEHLAYQWLTREEAAKLAKSPSNREAIEEFIPSLLSE